jgi:hypothetical protein
MFAVAQKVEIIGKITINCVEKYAVTVSLPLNKVPHQLILTLP